MSRLLGEIRQLGYVVPDIEAAMHHWSRVSRPLLPRRGLLAARPSEYSVALAKLRWN